LEEDALPSKHKKLVQKKTTAPHTRKQHPKKKMFGTMICSTNNHPRVNSPNNNNNNYNKKKLVSP